jgi:hypothetical protein
VAGKKMTQDQRTRLEAIKTKHQIIQNKLNRVLSDTARAEEEADDEKVELIITLAEKEIDSV